MYLIEEFQRLKEVEHRLLHHHLLRLRPRDLRPRFLTARGAGDEEVGGGKQLLFLITTQFFFLNRNLYFDEKTMVDISFFVIKKNAYFCKNFKCRMKEVSRKDYIEQLDRKKRNGLIKIITGIRRCGKSYLLFTLFKRHLLQIGVPENHIISLALDDYGNRQFLNPDALYNYVRNQIVDDQLYYILLDEIQLVKGFEYVLNGFLRISNADIYVTGSNSRFLSSDIITEFRGRGDEIRMYPFSYAEVKSIYDDDDKRLWPQYCRFGGMPLVWLVNNPEDRETYLRNLFNQVYFTDIISRYNIKGVEEISTLTDILASSVGSLSNPKRISDTFLSNGHKGLSSYTIAHYIDYLADAFILHKVSRYDVKGRKYIGTPLKYYFADIGLRNARLNFRQQEETHIMENIIYNELLRRRLSVDVGVVSVNTVNPDRRHIRKQLEVDFVVNKADIRYYIQSALSINDPDKRSQEEQSLIRVDDSFKKIIIQGNATEPWHDDNGILHIDVEQFLLNDDSLNW